MECSWNHPEPTRLTSTRIKSQLDRTSAAIEAATGKEPALFRPPCGAINSTVEVAAPLSPVLWDVGTRAWTYPDAARVAQYVITHAERNDVVLLASLRG